MATAFWDDLQDDVRNDPIRAEQLAIEIAQIQSIDLAINRIGQARNAQGLSKAELATKIGKDPELLRRLTGVPCA